VTLLPCIDCRDWTIGETIAEVKREEEEKKKRRAMHPGFLCHVHDDETLKCTP